MKLKILTIVKPESDNTVPADKLIDVGKEGASFELNNSPTIQIRTGGDFADHAFWLDHKYDWVLGLDRAGETILVPLKK